MIIQTQRICTSQPVCLCVGEVNAWDECCCTGGGENCDDCGAPFEVIDLETGNTVEMA